MWPHYIVNGTIRLGIFWEMLDDEKSRGMVKNNWRSAQKKKKSSCKVEQKFLLTSKYYRTKRRKRKQLRFQRGNVLPPLNYPGCLYWESTIYSTLCQVPREVIHHRKEASAIVSEFNTSKSNCKIRHTVILSCMHFPKGYPVPMYCLPRARMTAGELEKCSPCPHTAFSLKRWTCTINTFSSEKHNQSFPFK